MGMESIHRELKKGTLLPPGAPREDFLALRPKVLGGSDIGVITGDNPYKKQLRLKLEKREEVEPDEANYLMRVGSHMEAFIRDDFREEKTGWSFGPELGTIQHREIKHFAASVDDWALDEGGNTVIIDYKNVSSYGARKWKGGGLPTHYYAQGQWYMMVLESWVPGKAHFDACYFRAIVDNRASELRVIQRDEEWIRKAAIAANEFWQAMLTDDMEHFLKDIDGDEATSSAILAAYPGESQRELLLKDEDIKSKIDRWCMAYKRARAMQEEVEGNVRRLKSSIQSVLKNATKAKTDSFNINWPVVRARQRFDTRVLSAKHPDLNLSDYMTTGGSHRGGLTITERKGK
jgi:putative phage-type endonuclease